MKFFDTHKMVIGEEMQTPFLQKDNNYQDGTSPMYRDANGRLWAMSGHSHMGAIHMFSGTSLDDMKKEYEISLNFCVGHADYAFSGIRYPDGNKPVGSIWPFGLYICPNTHRFFCFFHNETGWNGKGTGYDAYGLCATPKMDSDFRHVGLMHSDDEGKNWTFDRWVLTGEDVNFTRRYNPGAGNVLGQEEGLICFGSGDFSVYIEPDGEYIYMFYNKTYYDMATEKWTGCHTYVARSRKRADGVMGDFVKYYDGAFCEAGNFGRETLVVENAWHPSVAYSKKYGVYVMVYSIVNPESETVEGIIPDVMEVRTSKDLVNWSEPIRVERNGKEFGNHYVSIFADDDKNQPFVFDGDDFSLLTNHNGTDVARFKTKILPM